MPIFSDDASLQLVAEQGGNNRQVAPAGFLTRDAMLVQEIETDFGFIEDIEVLMGTYGRRNDRIYEWLLLDRSGSILHRRSFRARDVDDNRYASIGLQSPIDHARAGGLFLVLRALDATPDDSITAWLRFGNDQTPVVRVAGRRPQQAANAIRSRAAGTPWPTLGLCLCYRVIGPRGTAEPAFRQPPLVAARLDRLGTERPRCLWLQGPHDTQPAGINAAFGDCIASGPDGALDAIRQGEIDLLIVLPSAAAMPLRGLWTHANTLHIPTALILPPAASGAASSPPSSSNKVEADSESAKRRLRQALRHCNFALYPDASASRCAVNERKRGFPIDPGSGVTPDLRRTLLDTYRRLHRPRVSIVTILSDAAAGFPEVLESCFLQTYLGEIEVVCMVGASPGDSSADATAAFERLRSCHSRQLDFKLVRNPYGGSRWSLRCIGIAAATGDLLVIVGADALLNRNFIARHVDAHAFDDCEVVVGPINIGTGGHASQSLLETYEAAPAPSMQRSELPDPVNDSSFLNCTARNLSARRDVLAESLSTPLPGYSHNPELGFEWEDIELGYRLYERGARIKFVPEAFTIRFDGGQSASPVGAAPPMDDFRRLLGNHPEIENLARRWTVATYGKLRDRTVKGETTPGDGANTLDVRLGKRASLPSPFRTDRRYRVLTYRWHVPHQYEIYKLPFDFTLVTGLGNPSTDEWDYGQRPMPANARFRRAAEIDPRDYDFAILHFDENVLSPENTNGAVGPQWGDPFKWFREEVDLPKVAVCHGTPQFHGQYDINYDKPDLLHVMETERLKMVDYLGDVPVVCNSHQAMHEWGFRDARVIWHGFDPTEFLPGTYERGIVSPLGPLVMSRPHYRGYFLYQAVFDGHWDELRPQRLQVPEPHPLYEGNAYAWGKYRNYVDELRRYTVYFNPTQRSPMPRARGEPMMCGVVTVSASNHDVGMFIENGVNGFHSNDPDELRENLRFLIRNPVAARRMGEASRRTAMDVFNHDRFLADWRNLIREKVH